jgi:hypothetical protein
MPCIVKDQALVPQNLRREKHPLPELGTEAYVWVRALTAREVMDLRARFGDKQSTDSYTFACEAIALCCVDDDGARLFEDGADVQANLHVMVPSMTALADRCVIVSGLAVDPEKK